MKAQIPEELGGIALGIEEQVQIAAGVLIGDQVRDDIVHETFALMGAADGHTAQCIAKAAACRNDVHIVIIHAAGVVEVGVPADSFGLKQAVDLAVRVAVGRIYFGNCVFRH